MLKLLDFLNFNLTNPLVPNLAHVFSWEPALGLANSRAAAAEEVQKKSIAIFGNKQ